MNERDFEKELRIKYAIYKKVISNPFELLDLVELENGMNKAKAVEIAEEIYFNCGRDPDEQVDRNK